MKCFSFFFLRILKCSFFHVRFMEAYSVFSFSQQLISAFERALEMTVDVPSEAHSSLSQDYIKCLSKVGKCYMPQL